MGYLILVIFVVEIFVLAILDRMLFGTYITPITVLSFPYLFIVLLAIIFGPGLGFFPFYYPSLWIWIIGLPIFWIPGFILATVFLQKTNIYNYPYSVITNIKLDNLIINLSYLTIVILVYGFLNAYSKTKIGSANFESAFGSGIVGHTLLISKLFFIYLIVRFRKINLVPLSILIFFYFSYGGKGWIFIPLISGILIRVLLRKTSLSFSLITKVLVLVFIVFYIVYRIALGPAMPFSFVFTQVFRYAFAGVLGLSEYIKQQCDVGINPTAIINPIINIYYKFSGSGVLNTFENIMTNIGNGASTNVKTFFGTIYIYAGPAWGCFFSFIIGTFSYLFLITTIKTKNIIFLIIYGTFLTMFLFGWFDTYSSNLFFYEFPVFGLLMFVICPYLAKIRILKNKL